MRTECTSVYVHLNRDRVMSCVLTIENYLRGFVNYDIPDSTFRSILFKVGIEDGVAAEDVEPRERDISLAWVYLWCAGSPSVKNNTKDSDGGWEHTEGGWQMTEGDKRRWRAMARALFEKWDEELPPECTRPIVLKSY